MQWIACILGAWIANDCAAFSSRVTGTLGHQFLEKLMVAANMRLQLVMTDSMRLQGVTIICTLLLKQALQELNYAIPILR